LGHPQAFPTFSVNDNLALADIGGRSGQDGGGFPDLCHGHKKTRPLLAGLFDPVSKA
jgi:hypothetical protein